MISIWPLYQTRSNGTATVAGEVDDNWHQRRSTPSTRFIPTRPPVWTYHFYDTFNAMARSTLTYQQDYDSPDRQVRVGRDLGRQHRAPERTRSGVNVHAATTASVGKGAFTINAYPLEH